MTVLLNKWDGQRFENQVICTRCGRKTVVKKVMGDAQYCKGCLFDFITEIDQAVLIAASDGKVKGDDACKECDGLGKINAWLHEGVQVIGCPTCKGMGRKNPVRKEGS